MSYAGTVVVIPTRNRATLAIEAIRSVLEQRVKNVALMVSDNSTNESDRTALGNFCAGYPEEALRYVQPPQSLSMPAHWDWAISEALNHYPASHFIYLTDRMMFRRSGLAEVIDLAARFPEKVISYNHDRILDDARPIRFEQYPATEKLLEIDSARLCWLFSQSVFPHALPRMLNCIVPREVFDRIRKRFHNIFSSISPDFNFCWRCLEMEESILFYDKSPIFHYALSRSNGYSASRGEMTADYADFAANLPVDHSMVNSATPIAGLTTSVNYAFNEYCLLKEQTKSPKFFDINMQNYLDANAGQVFEITDPTIRERMLSLLVAKGYRAEQSNGQTNALSVTLRARAHAKLKRILTGPATKWMWLFLARTLTITPPGQNQFEFASLADAVDYAKNISRGNVIESQAFKEVFKAREIPTR